MDQKQSLSFAVIVLISIVGGFFLGYFFTKQEVYTLKSQIEKAKKFFPDSGPITVVAGAVTSVDKEGNTFTLSGVEGISPFEKLPEKRIVHVTAETTIIQTVLKDSKVFQKEIDAYTAKLHSGKGGVLISAPTPYIEKSASLSDISPGDVVSVEAGEDIKLKEEFEATKIVIQRAP